MKVEFNLEKVTAIEFGVGRHKGSSRTFTAVPVDQQVQNALLAMVQATLQALQKYDEEPMRYQPSEKHASTEYLYVPLHDDLARAVREIHQAANLLIDAAALADPPKLFCYFARFTDATNRRLTGIRRATQFKGIIKSKNRLVRMLDDTLRIIEDNVFKLDNDFDIMIDDCNIHILRPSGFEFVGGLQQAILDAVPQNIEEIKQDLPFVDFETIGKYAAMHPRAARQLASIRAQNIKNIDKSKLIERCQEAGVKVNHTGSELSIERGYELAFLELLDRRRYEISLVEGKTERYRAASRMKIGD